jgi:hypothetical protein
MKEDEEIDTSDPLKDVWHKKRVEKIETTTKSFVEFKQGRVLTSNCSKKMKKRNNRFKEKERKRERGEG